jgi:hypothetical protein
MSIRAFSKANEPMTVGQLTKVSRMGHSSGRTCFSSLCRISVRQINILILRVRGIDMAGMLAVEID